MVRFIMIENDSYRIVLSNALNNYIEELKYINECKNESCMYSRNITKMRNKFEEKIVASLHNNNNINILFYSSFLLYQEFQILKLLANKISEIHFTDYAYNDFLCSSSNNIYILAFQEFLNYITKNNLKIRLYVHSNPDKLFDTIIYQRRFDIICGIDIDSSINKIDNRVIMKKIAQRTLKINGIMILSQNFADQIDLCCYKISDSGNIEFIHSDDYVKPEYYIKYSLQNIIYHSFYPLKIAGLTSMINFLPKISASFSIFGMNPIVGILASTCCLVYLFYDIIIFDGKNYRKRNIKNFSEIIA